MLVTALALAALLVLGAAGSAVQCPGGSVQCNGGVAVGGGDAADGGGDCAGAFNRMTHHPDDAPPRGRTTIQRFRYGEYRRCDKHQLCGDSAEFGCDETAMARSDSRVRGGYRPWMDSAAVDCDAECRGSSDEKSCTEKCLNGTAFSDHEWRSNSRWGGVHCQDGADEADGAGTTTTSTSTATSQSSAAASDAPLATPTQTTSLVREDAKKSPLGLYLGAGLGVLVASLLASSFFVYKAVRRYNRNRAGYPASDTGEGALPMLCDASVAGRAAEALELLRNPASTDL